MSDRRPSAFLAYPSQDSLIAETLAATGILSRDEPIEICPWAKMEPYGLKIDDLIRDKIDDTSFLIADITYPNFNVYYEMGYAIAQQKPVLLTIYNGAEVGEDNARITGLFDNIGWIKYDNSAELLVKTQKWKKEAWIERYKKPRDFLQPLFVLDLYVKSNFRQYIFEAISNRSVNVRTFDPFENPSFTVATAIAEMSASSGCILPLLRLTDRDFQKHNLRAAFLAGCAHGLEIEPLIIQYDGGPAPLDYRDFIKNTKGQQETHRHVEDYCGQVLIRNQRASNRATLPLSMLSLIEIGNASAENETESLHEYFVQTAEFRRAQRTDHAIIVGRKGSGKTAILNQLKREAEANRDTVIVELRPATHDLSAMRYEILKVAQQGVFDHTIAAFWQYILYMEILLSIREKIIPYIKNNFELQNRIIEIEEKFSLTQSFVSADFTSRLEDAINALIDGMQENGSRGDIEELTNIMYEVKIPELRDSVIMLSDQYDDIYLLFDDLDKGWPPQQLENHDVMLIRHLIEGLRRIERELRRRKIKFRGKLFLRSDVYENLVEVTSDRNKDVVIRIDWSDPQQLIGLIRKRATHKFPLSEHDKVWQAFNPVLADGHFAMDSLVKGALYRPRFLIDLCETMLAVAINRDANFVDGDDVEKALTQFSRYLVSEWGLELRDISGIPKDIFYSFIGNPEILTRSEIQHIVEGADIGISADKLIDLFLWYGFLGVAKSDSERVFIFDCGYDFRRLQVHKTAGETFYCVNNAFLRGLELL